MSVALKSAGVRIVLTVSESEYAEGSAAQRSNLQALMECLIPSAMR